MSPPSSSVPDRQEFDDSAQFAQSLDAADPLRDYRRRFHLPTGADGKPLAYFCGNSLGLQPRGVAERLQEELQAWSRDAVDGHFKEQRPWYSYHEQFRASGARLVGAEPDEIVMMNSLTVNLHLMMVSFYRPTASRRKILIEYPAFPSDLYAVRSQIAFHGFDPDEALSVLRPRGGESALRTEDIVATIDRQGSEIALVMLAGVNFYSGQALEMGAIAAAARKAGCRIGFDLAHAAGNIPLKLHDWDVDFAVWCSYKYLNAGPGAIAGCFVHRRHAADESLPRFAGWWGNDPATRFRMQLEDRFRPHRGADGWQLSNPPILAMVPLISSLAIFDEAGMPALRKKSEALTTYLERWVRRAPGVRCITPEQVDRRGCQLSLRIADGGRARFEALHAAGIVTDFREPDVIRMAPVPLYNSFEDCRRAGLELLRS